MNPRPLFDSYKQAKYNHFVEKHCVFDKATYLQWKIYRLQLKEAKAHNKSLEYMQEIRALEGELQRLEATDEKR